MSFHSIFQKEINRSFNSRPPTNCIVVSAVPFKLLVSTYQTTHHHNPQERNVHTEPEALSVHTFCYTWISCTISESLVNSTPIPTNLTGFVAFLSPSRQTVRQYLQITHKNINVPPDSSVTITLQSDILQTISPITGPRCPEGSRKLRFPDYVTMAQDGGKVVSLTHQPLLPPGNTPGTHFC